VPEHARREYTLAIPNLAVRRHISSTNVLQLTLPDDSSLPTLAAMTAPGVIHSRNADAVAAYIDPDTGVISAAVADGLSSGVNSERAARVAADAAVESLTRSQDLRQAVAVAAAVVANLALPGQVRQPAASILVIQVDGAIGRSAHLGDIQLDWQPDHGDPESLTEEDINPITGGLIKFLGETPNRAPAIHTHTFTAPGFVVITTNGLRGATDDGTPSALAAIAGGDTNTNPIDVVARLARHALDRGVSDDFTALAIRIGPQETPGPGGGPGPSVR
jgi:protein phosphatase